MNVSKVRGCKEDITGDAKAWLLSIARLKPKNLGYTVETLINKTMTKNIREAAKEAEYERLTTISESEVYRIMDKADIKPFRIR